MNFELEEDDAALVEGVASFCAKRIEPEAAHWDALPDQLWSELEELGVLDFTALELSCAAASAVLERIARADASTALVVAAYNANGLDAGSEVTVSGEGTLTGVAPLVTSRPIRVTAQATTYDVDASAAGVTVTPAVGSLGMRAAGLAAVQLRDASARVVGPADEGMALIALGSIAVGIGRAALGEATAYAKEREQFGEPIANFQAIQWKLANMATDLAAAWVVGQRASWLKDAGRPYVDAAGRFHTLAARGAGLATSEALQIHGGYGYTREFAVERHVRDARFCALTDGRCAVAEAIVARFASG